MADSTMATKTGIVMIWYSSAMAATTMPVTPLGVNATPIETRSAADRPTPRAPSHAPKYLPTMDTTVTNATRKASKWAKKSIWMASDAKYSGTNTACTICVRICRTRSDSACASPAIMPARKNPSRAVSPTDCVTTPHSNPRQQTKVSTTPGCCGRRAAKPASARSTSRGPSVRQKAVNPTAATSSRTTDPGFGAAVAAVANTRLRITQASTSLTA